MNNVGIRELRDGFSRHLAEVRGGKTITITLHGKPIARIMPVEGLTGLERLVAEGRVRRPERRKRPAPIPAQADGTGRDLPEE